MSDDKKETWKKWGKFGLYVATVLILQANGVEMESIKQLLQLFMFA